MIAKTNVLNEKQRKEIKEVVQACFLYEPLERELYLENDMNYYEDLNCFFLYYHQEKLISILTIYQAEEFEVEITGYTLPEYRRQGYFTELLYEAEEELLQIGIDRITFAVETKGEDSKHFLRSLNAQYKKSEYILQFNVSESKFYDDKSNHVKAELKITELMESHIDEVSRLSGDIFDQEVDLSKELIELAFYSDNMSSLIGVKDGRIIGICNVSFDNHYGSIYGIGIEKSMQGKGYGKSFLELVMKYLYHKGASYIGLQVSSENKSAFNLYRNYGFMIKSQYDYYDYEIEYEEY